MKMRSRRRVLRRKSPKAWVARAAPQPSATHGNQSVAGVSQRLTAAQTRTPAMKAERWMRKTRIAKSLNMALNMPRSLAVSGSVYENMTAKRDWGRAGNVRCRRASWRVRIARQRHRPDPDLYPRRPERPAHV